MIICLLSYTVYCSSSFHTCHEVLRKGPSYMCMVARMPALAFWLQTRIGFLLRDKFDRIHHPLLHFKTRQIFEQKHWRCNYRRLSDLVPTQLANASDTQDLQGLVGQNDQQVLLRTACNPWYYHDIKNSKSCVEKKYHGPAKHAIHYMPSIGCRSNVSAKKWLSHTTDIVSDLELLDPIFATYDWLSSM